MTQKWSDMKERGVWGGILFVAFVYRTLGRTACMAVMAPIVAYFYVTGPSQRRASFDYQKRMWKAGKLKRKPGYWSGLRQFMNFSVSMLDRLAAWTGDIKPSDVNGVHDGLFDEAKWNGKGAVVLTSHLGSPDVIRAVATTTGRFRVNVLMHTAHAENFNRMIERFSPDAPVRMVQVSQIDVSVAMTLSEAISRGEWVVMAADRVGVKDGESSAVAVDFLGGKALFPTGPYILAAALGCPAYSMFCTRRGKTFDVAFETIAEKIELPRGRRAEALTGYARIFASRVEAALAETPFQWFNFYDYWAPASAESAAAPGGADQTKPAVVPAI